MVAALLAAPSLERSMPSPPRATPASADLPDDATVRALLARARAADDVALRALVYGYVALRHALADVLAFLAAREGGAAVASVPALARARALVASSRRSGTGGAA